MIPNRIPVYRRILLPLLAALTSLPALAQHPGDSAATPPYLPSWNFMSLSTAGVDTFLLEHPTYDGRGVMVLIFDTGIDPSIPGLQLTSTGEPKVVDLVDVSGSNVVQCFPADNDDGRITSERLQMELKDAGSLVPPPLPGDGNVFTGVMHESRYKNATVRDFDGDGSSSSEFGVLLYRASDGWRVAVDADTDGSLAGEKSLRNYSLDRETMRFPQEFEGAESPISPGVRIDTAARSVVFHYDMNGHGTHVGGIAAGRSINGEEGFNGVAPGAQLISVKFASDPDDDLTIAGTMKRAYEYAAALSDSLAADNIPVVVNMSFGIGSAYEGKAQIEDYLDRLLPKHPNLYVVTSAGNAGPGLSTVGIPAAANRVISVGALLPFGIGRDSYSALIDQDVLWDFSSRGGEVDKPDVVAPGTAISTIPRFSYDMRASGTSMASPYTAGVVAVLLSALKQEFPGWVPTQSLIRRALRVSAVHMPDYAYVEQGGGSVHVGRAFDLLKRWRRSGFADGIQEYEVHTFSPSYPEGQGFTSYWRSGYVPGKDWRQEFTVFRNPAVEVPDGESDSFFRAYALETTDPWLKTVQKNVYIRDNDPATIEVLYDAEKMKEPGLYCGKVIARRAKGTKATPKDEVEFELVNTVIVPYRFRADDRYTVTIPDQEVKVGGTRRYYFAPPGGASAITFTLSVPKGSSSSVSGSIADRFGETDHYLPYVKGKDRSEGSSTISLSSIGDGIIEVIVEGDMFEGSGSDSKFTLSAEALMLTVKAETVASDSGADLRLTAHNTGTTRLKGTFEYTVKGYSRVVRDTIRDGMYRMPIKLSKYDGALWIAGHFTPEEYMKSTDILLRLVDSSGQVQAREAYNSPEEWVFLPNFNRGTEDTWYFLEIVFGSAYEPSGEGASGGGSNGGAMASFDSENNKDAVPFELIEKHVRPTEFEKLGSYDSRTLYPYLPRTYVGELPELEGGIPEGYVGLGEVRFTAENDEDRKVEAEFTVSGR